MASSLKLKASLGTDFASLYLNEELSDIVFVLPTATSTSPSPLASRAQSPSSSSAATASLPLTTATSSSSLVPRAPVLAEQEASEEEKIPAHRLILAARSPVFRTMLFGTFVESQKQEIKIPDISARVFKLMLHYIYTDEITVDPSTIMGIVYAAKKYALAGLCEGCIAYLEESIAPDTVCNLLSQALLFTEDELAGMCMQFLRENVDILLKPDTPVDLSKQALIEIIKDDYVCLPEVAIFKLVMDWVDHQRKSCESPDEQHTDDDMVDFLPHIRFPLMTEQELSGTVVPRKVLSDAVLVEVFVFKALPKGATCRFKATPRQISFKTKHILFRSGKQIPNAIGNWGFSGAIDAVSVKVDKPIWLHGFGLFPGNGGGLNGIIKVHQGDSAQAGPVLGEAEFTGLISRGEDIENVMFPTPIAIEPDTVYTLIQFVESTQIRSKQFQGTRHGSSCIPMEGVAFVFSDSVNSSNNGTGPFGGQIPALIWSLRSTAAKP